MHDAIPSRILNGWLRLEEDLFHLQVLSYLPPQIPICYAEYITSASAALQQTKNPQTVWFEDLWWSIVSNSRTFRQAYRCCGQSASNQETEALRNASAPAHELF